MKLHIHFNQKLGQVCELKQDLKVGETATVHVHDVPMGCKTCSNGHCHAPNVSISRIDEETIFLAFEDLAESLTCDIKDLPLHGNLEH